MPNRFHPLALLLFLSLAVAASGTAEAEVQAREKPTAAAPSTEEKAGDEAAEKKNPYEERFRELDRDGDGYVTLGEWPLAPESFPVVDRNKDGRLSRTELLTPNTLRRDRQAERFRQLDRDGDGRLSPRERPPGDRTFDRLDRNRDGYVSRQESALGDPENAWNARTAPRTRSAFRDLDRNSDNRLGILEWTGPAASFHRLDRNRDGYLSPQELSRE